MEQILKYAKHRTPNTRWTRALKKLIKLRDAQTNSDAYLERFSRQISLNRGSDYALAEILESTGCPKHPTDVRSSTYMTAIELFTPDLLKVMVFDFAKGLYDEKFEDCIQAIRWGYRQEIPNDLINELHRICDNPPCCH